MRIIFSRDRAAQLDLLLQSLEANTVSGNTATTAVLYRATSRDFMSGYDLVQERWPLVRFHQEQDFNTDLRAALTFATSGHVTFLCDDNVLYRKVPSLGGNWLENERILTFSLRLAGWPQSGTGTWHWADLPPHDHGYPGSIDGHTFRVSDVQRMLGDDTVENPLMLETVLARRARAWHGRPLMAAYEDQCLVGVPVNTVADDHLRPHGQVYPQPADEMNDRFLNGERIALEELDFSGVNGCLHEIPFVWTSGS